MFNLKNSYLDINPCETPFFSRAYLRMESRIQEKIGETKFQTIFSQYTGLKNEDCQ